MYLLFATLLCHRDVNIFKFNWFTSRMHLDHGFDQKHLVLTDGSLTPADINTLQTLPGVTVDPDPVIQYAIPNPILTAKIQLFERGFLRYGADQVIVIDADIFFYRPWDFIIKKILTTKAICLRDWGSSLGLHPDKFKELFGVGEDAITPNCNTGVYSIPKEMYNRIPPVMEKHIKTPFHIMEDQGIFFAAYYGMMDYITEIQCLINGIEEMDYTWSHILNNTCGAHLQGMRVRPKALKSLVYHSINNCPRKLHLSQITPVDKFVNYGLMAFGCYDFTKPWQAYPSLLDGRYIMDGLHMHGGSWAEWKLPREFIKFVSRYVCLHTGIPQNCRPCRINGQEFRLGEQIEVPLQGTLRIETDYSEGAHLCFISPMLSINLTVPNMEF